MDDWREQVKRASAYDLERGGAGGVVCFYCLKPMPGAHQSQRRCIDCGPLLQAKRSKAGMLIYKAMQAGRLPKASTLTCVDCGKPAACWDHRDYDKPLEVEPVCIGCNRKRGPALAKLK